MKEVAIEKIVEILNNNIEDVDLTINQLEDDLIAIGMDSITFIRIIVALEEEYECEVPDLMLDITQMNSIAKIYEVLKSISIENLFQADGI